VGQRFHFNDSPWVAGGRAAHAGDAARMKVEFRPEQPHGIAVPGYTLEAIENAVDAGDRVSVHREQLGHPRRDEISNAVAERGTLLAIQQRREQRFERRQNALRISSCVGWLIGKETDDEFLGLVDPLRSGIPAALEFLIDLVDTKKAVRRILTRPLSQAGRVVS